MTGLGGSIVRPDVRAATEAAMSRFVRVHELQRHASEVIARLTGAEAGCVTASASAGITLCVAGCMTGLDPARVEALPRDPGPKFEVVVQAGHLCDYGAPISTAIELAGATVRQVGQSTLATDYQLDAALTERTAAALYVVSHHVVHYGQIPLGRFVAMAHARGVPVIVDAASEYDLTGFIRRGPTSRSIPGRKFFGGPTAGIIAGRRELVRSAYLQNTGIGRGLKVGKESIAGVIAAMEAWMVRDHAAIRRQETAALDLWLHAVAGLPGISAAKVPDPTQTRSSVCRSTSIRARPEPRRQVARALGDQDPAIIVRNHEVELGYFQLDPCNLAPGQMEIVAERLVSVLSRGKDVVPNESDLAAARNGGTEGYLNWLA